ncbi:MAG: cob(I)yrinic acid a,c-diamide adenosyltransferase [Dehalococcoidales bacterium]|nr:cob(I)yrinic acid a,c-diamide adenosyltransferase [Dehalococcoidales bacterium]
MGESVSAGQIKTNRTRGLVIINTGEGKGKTTAAFGLLLRAWGHDMKVIMLQFIKNKKANFGEHRAARRIGVEILAGGAGFVRPGVTKDLEKSREMSRELWDLAREKINSGDYDMVILDELSYPLQFGWLTVDEVIEALRQRPEKLHVVITGRAVPEKLVEYADTVTEMKEIKHHFRQGVPARPGIEF